MKNTLSNVVKYLSVGSFSLAIYNTINNKSIHNVTKQLENERLKLQELSRKYQELLTNKLFDSELNNSITFDKIKSLENEIKILQNKISAQQNIIANLDLTKTEDILSQLTDLSKTFKSSNSELNNMVEILEKYINSKNSNNFTGSILEIFISINTYIQSLSIEQNLAFIHITGAIFLIFALFSLLTIFYGDYFLTKWNIENKYPKLAIFIKIRRKFQHFYFLSNFIISLLVLLAIIFINIYINFI